MFFYNLSAGEVAMPFFSLYNCTKAAVMSLTETLGHELKDWGVKVSLIEPSGFQTGENIFEF